MRSATRKFLRYACTGGTAAVVDAGVFALLIHAGTSAPVAAASSFVLAAILNFQLSARFVFDHKPTGRAFALFLLGALCGLVINVTATLVAIHGLGVTPVLAKVLGIGVAFGFNFLLNLLVVFPSAKPRAGEG